MRKIFDSAPAALLALALTAAAGGLAFAAGGGGDGTATTPTCKPGMVWDQAKGICVQQKSEAVPDEQLADYAYALARQERFQEALDVITLMHDPLTPKALNYKGYATRKLGRIEEGIGYYLESVRLDPDYTLVREYLGEAYVQVGRTDLAKEQLGEIQKRCGTDCRPYRELSDFLSKGI